MVLLLTSLGVGVAGSCVTHCYISPSAPQLTTNGLSLDTPSLPPFFSPGNISWNQSLPNQFTEHFLISYDRHTLFPICWTMIYSARPLGWALRLFPACPNPNSAVVNHCAAVFYNWAKNLGDTGWKGVCICDLSALITSPYWVHSNLYLSVPETWVKVQGSLRYMAVSRSWGL